MPLGVHMSISGGIAKAFARGAKVGCDAMQIFCKNDRQWNAKPYSAADIADFKAEQLRTGITPVIVHSSYLINLAAPGDEIWEKSIAACADELERCALLEVPYLVLHPGSHTGSGEEAGLQRIATALNRLFSTNTGAGVMLLLETTAGQGTALGWRFEHLASLLDLVTYPDRLGICVDTCHLLAAGYDIRSAEAFASTFAEFDRIVGLPHIKAFHLNDSQKELGSRVDRHTHIGQGYVGLEAFRLLRNDPRFRDIPMIIETPKGKDINDTTEDMQNLSVLRSLQA